MADRPLQTPAGGGLPPSTPPAGPSTCGADAYQAQAHTCDDPLACALERLIDGNDPTEAELERLHEVLDEIEALTHGRKTLRSEVVLKLIHDERGGPR